MHRANGEFLDFRRQWLAFGMGVLLLCVAVAISVYRDHAQVTAREKSQLTAMSRVMQVAIEQNLGAVSQSLASIRDARGHGLSDGALNDRLQALAEAMPTVNAIFVLDATGTIQAASHADWLNANTNHRQQDYFQSPKNKPSVDTLYVSTPFRNAQGSYTIALSRMMADPSGAFAGTVTAVVNPAYFEASLESIRYAPSVTAALQHGDGILFMMLPHSKDAYTGVQLDQPGSFFAQHRLSGRSMSIFSGVLRSTGEDRMLVIREERAPALHMDKPIGVVIARLRRDIYASWRQDALIATGLAVLAVLAFAWGLLAYQRRHRALLASEALFHLAIESLHEGFILHDQHGTTLQANASAERMMGLTASQMKGLTPLDLTWRSIHEDGSDFPVDSYPAMMALRHGVSQHGVVIGIYQPEGELLWMLVNSTLIGRPEQPQGVVVTFVDITQRKQLEAAALRSQSMLKRSEHLAQTGSWEWNPHTDEVTWSLETYRFFERDPALGAPHYAELKRLFTPIDGQRMAVAVSQALVDGVPYDIELCRMGPNGKKRYCRVLGVPERDASGKVVLLAGSLQDITERKQAQARQQLAASVFTHAREGITITDALGVIIDVNEMFTQITGYSREEVVGQNPRILQSGRQDPAFYKAMWHALATQGHWSGEIWNRRKNGEVYPEILTISAVRDDAGSALHYVALFSDITTTKMHLSELERIAHYDTLTGLPNRFLLNDRLRQAIAHAQRNAQTLAVIFLDLDNIKGVNDTYGHEAGDTVLVAISKAMQGALREGDTLARMGGDEFVVVLVDLDQPQDCLPVIERLLAAAATLVRLPSSTEGDDVAQEQSVQVSASIGVTFYPQDDVDADVLMRHADQAMYVAKQAGKNGYHFFDIANDAAIHSRHEELSRIGDALERGEFILYYQPKVNMRTGAVMGAEALIRWQHPERGVLAPGVFLPVIENHPLSIAVGEWAIDTALAQMSAWRAQGLALVVSVNIGALQLQQDNFVQRLSAMLAAHPDVTPDHLQLEILETSALEDVTKTTAVMHACRAMNVAFALDDFGTGYSSLTYLKHLPAEILKIDQSFIRDMADDPDDLAIVQGVIGLAQVFHREVIAEGVETRALGDLLLDIGCELAQGYGIARPMPAQKLPAWVVLWGEGAAWTA